MARRARRLDRRARPRTRHLAPAPAVGTRARARREPAAGRQHALRQHHRPRSPAAVSRRPRRRVAPHGDRALERARDGRAREPRPSGELGGHIASYASAADLFEVGFHHFFRAGAAAATSSTSSRTRRPACTRARSSKAASTSRSSRTTAARPAAAGSAVVSASLVDARLLAVPDRVDGHRPDQRDLPGALHALPRAPRARAHDGPARVGLRRRRRDGRAGIARRPLARGARAARQPRVRRQLQPAAARRPGARQRLDRAGAGERSSPAPAGT